MKFGLRSRPTTWLISIRRDELGLYSVHQLIGQAVAQFGLFREVSGLTARLRQPVEEEGSSVLYFHGAAEM